jgi:hypothetical protein
MLKGMKDCNWLSLWGYEIEDDLIAFANHILGLRTEKKDLLELKPKDLAPFDTIYFWEPLAREELAKKFVDVLSAAVKPGQNIIYRSDGSIGRYLHKAKNIKPLITGEPDWDGQVNNHFGGYQLYRTI